MEVDDLWDYSDPARSEDRFRLLMDTVDESQKNELLTQIARTYSLRNMFDEAHEILDQVANELPRVTARIEVRYLLERGRTWNSSGQKEKAQEVFLKAFDVARRVGDDHLTIDVAHMLAIVSEHVQALEWNLLALRIVNETRQERAKRWFGSLSNNIAWSYHELGDYQAALLHFNKASEYFTSLPKEPALRIARWSVARCQRSLGNIEIALAEQLNLLTEYYPGFNSASPNGEIDGYILEEIAECYYALGQIEESKLYFRTAYLDLQNEETERLVRMLNLSN